MRTLLVLLASLAACGAAPLKKNPPLVDIRSLEPGIIVDIRYATADNFLKTKVYPSNRCFLVPSAAERLAKAHRALKAQGVGLKVWDGYRPLSAQKKLWALNPDA